MKSASTRGSLQRRVLSAAAAAILAVTAFSGLAAAQGTHTAKASATGTIKACSVLTSSNAARALRGPVTSSVSRRVGGFSQCVYWSGGKFAVVFEIASTAMLMSYNGTTARHAYNRIKAHSLTGPLQTLGPDIAFAPGYVVLDLMHGVVYDATFVRSNGRHNVPDQVNRLSEMLVPISEQLSA